LEAESQSSTSKVLTLFNAFLNSFDKKIGENVKEILQKLSSFLTQKDILRLKYSNAIERSIKKSPSTFLLLEPFIYMIEMIIKVFNWLKCVTKDKRSLLVFLFKVVCVFFLHLILFYLEGCPCFSIVYENTIYV
jgi:hypothetical protein